MRRMSIRSLPRPRIIARRASSIKRAHRAMDGFQADEDRLADQEMADIEFADLRDGGDGLRHCRRSGRGRHGFPGRGRRRTPRALRICFSSSSRARRRVRHWHRRRCAVPPPARPATWAASICLRSGSMNMETRMPAVAQRRDDGLQTIVLAGCSRCRLRWCAPRASPARCRRHAACAFSAMASISSVAAISRLSGMVSALRQRVRYRRRRYGGGLRADAP